MNTPLEVKFCKKCVESNLRFIGSAQHRDQKGDLKQRTLFSEDRVCSACLYYEQKNKINWKEREKELADIFDQYRSNNDEYDVLVPGSGGKDSRYLSDVIKNKYKMNPLSCTWAPHMYTDVGWRNFQSWIATGLDNQLFTPNKTIHKKLTYLSFKNLLHPFQPFVMGQFYFPIRVALEKNIKLIIYGDSYAERGLGGNLHTASNSFNPALYTYKSKKDLFFGGESLEELKKFKIYEKDLIPYIPLKENLVSDAKLKLLQLPYFLNYNPQSNYYYSIQNTNFEVNPDGRTEGTYTKYASLDDKIDGLHHYTWFIKTGRGRATEDAAIEVRNNIITREEAVSLVKKYDGEFPKKYFREILEYLDINEQEFTDIIDSFRPEGLWKKNNGKWELKHAVWK